MILHLGVIDIPYAHDQHGTTTGDVAGYLERRYHVIDRFVSLQYDGIADALADSFAGSMENIMMGAPADVNVFGTAEGDVKEMFNRYIEDEEIVQTAAPGVPTKAALMGVNHRMKRARGPRRPSFRDTGLYVNSFTVWVEKD